MTCLDARSLLETFLCGVLPDSSVSSTASASSSRATSGGRCAYGEMVDLLCADGQPAAALLLEDLWNELQKQHVLTLFCAYDLARFEGNPST